MITKVVHGWRVGGLIAYLMGPGRAQEHRRPRVIASWDGRDHSWRPPRSGPGEWDLELDELIRALRAPAVAAGLGERPDDSGRRGYVWHCSARLADADRVLSDAVWAGIARELLAGAGVADAGDPGGPRWVAIRHADDHIHIAVVLVRQDTARQFWPYRDYPRLREAAQRIEQRLGLTVTAAADGTAARAPGRGELEKASRQGREPARVELARAIRAAAVTANDPDSFITALCEAGYLAQLRRAPSGDPLGYTVARPDDVSASGLPVFYSGSKLAPDLSLPRLLGRWAEIPGGHSVADPARAARLRVHRAHRAMLAARCGEHPDDAPEIAHAAADMLTALHSRTGIDSLRAAADLYDRAARAPQHQTGQSSASSRGLRRAARELIRQRHPVSDGDLTALVALAIAVTALIREIARWQHDLHRNHQAAAGRQAADLVDAWAHPGATTAAPRGPIRDHAAEHAPPRSRPRR